MFGKSIQRLSRFALQAVSVAWLLGPSACSDTRAGGGDAAVADTVGEDDATFDPSQVIGALRIGPDPTYEAGLFREVLRHLTEAASLPQDGDWPEDFGDANYYGPAFFQRYGAASGSNEQLLLAQQTTRHNQLLVTQAADDLLALVANPADTLMSALGLAEAIRVAPNASRADALRRLLQSLDSIAARADDYPTLGAIAGDIPTSIYGPTTLNGALALIHLEASVVLPAESEQTDHLARALEVLDHGEVGGFSAELGYYRMEPGDDALYLYPNVMQMLAYARAYQLTANATHLRRAEALYQAIQPLKVANEGRYRSPYGSSSDDFTSLSSQNYLMLALLVLHQVSGNESYRQEVLQILAFLREHLLVDGRVLHHWLDGAPPQPEHSVHYCSGCNLQLLYVIWRLDGG